MASLSGLFISLCLFILSLVYVYKWRSNKALESRKNLPPSPRKIPIIGNLHQLDAFPYRSLCSLSQRYGPLMLLHFGKVPVLVASSFDAAHEILKNNDLAFSNRPKSSITNKLAYGAKDVAFSPYGEYWRQMRSICVLQLLSNKRVQSFKRVREEATSNMIDTIRRLGCSSCPVNLSDLLASLTNGVICRAAFGKKYDKEGEGYNFKKSLEEVGKLLGTLCIGDYIPWLSWIDHISGLHARMDKVAKQFDEFLDGVIKEHRDQESENRVFGGNKDQLNFVDILLQFQRENRDTSPIEDASIKAIILDMFAAGTDTTYTALEWTIAELLRNPKTLKILQNEVRTVAGIKEEITEKDLEKMQYLKVVMKESLRLHGPAPLLVPRESTKDTTIMGYDIAAGTQAVINYWAIGRDPSLWEYPEEFRPERFFHTNIDYKGLDFELLPFGVGRRGCPGRSFALSIYELALAKLVHKFDMILPSGERGEDLDMSEVNGIVKYKKFPLMVLAIPVAS
ncbi:cytochrome P450 71A6-like [Primulina huaijiensis]|uniref:cytochrome P450 71A6-like n=1 Tax=Primulina huaijiensis TaxID=1492673 RepID=UPI003CC6E3D6